MGTCNEAGSFGCCGAAVESTVFASRNGISTYDQDEDEETTMTDGITYTLGLFR